MNASFTRSGDMQRLLRDIGSSGLAEPSMLGSVESGVTRKKRKPKKNK